jgi:nucleoside-diphosphate-sugar epimerase
VVGLTRKSSPNLNLQDLDGLEVVHGDVQDLESLKSAMKGVDTVFHVAAKVQIKDTRSDPKDTLLSNSIGAFNVATAAKHAGVRKLVHVSTCHVYGNQPETLLPLKEDVAPRPHDIYAVSKLAAEVLVRQLLEDGLDVTITRAFNIYGPGQTGDFFVAQTIRQLLQGETPALGNPTPTRDYNYVSDIAGGYLLAGEKGKPGKIYHFSSGVETSIGDMFKKIAEACGRSDIEASWKDFRKQDMGRSVGDSTKARKEMGWSPKIGLDEGLAKTVEWWRSHPEIWKR